MQQHDVFLSHTGIKHHSVGSKDCTALHKEASSLMEGTRVSMKRGYDELTRLDKLSVHSAAVESAVAEGLEVFFKQVIVTILFQVV